MADDMFRVNAAPRKISEIAADDAKVQILGTVVDRSADFFILDDGSGNVKVQLTAPEIDMIKTGQPLRVFGRVVQAGNEFEIRADFVQDMSGLDAQAWKKATEIWAKEVL